MKFALTALVALCLSLPTYAATADPFPIEAPEAIPAPTPVVNNSVVVYATEGDGLHEVNAKRAAHGLRPFVRDNGLLAAAMGAARFRATYRMFGHTSNDFAFVPAGVQCSSAGCAAYPADYGWMSCDVYDSYDRAGAYWALGSDGKRYMHLFVGHGMPVNTDSLPVAGADCPGGVCSTSSVVYQTAAPPVIVQTAPSVRVTETLSSRTTVTSGRTGLLAERFSVPFMERRGPVRTVLRIFRFGGCG